MNVEIRPSVLSGTVEAPPSKSYLHRLLICAALSDNGCKVKNISLSDDISATLDCIETLKSGNRVYNCRESGSTLRFFVPLSLVRADAAEFRGSERLIQRGIGEYEAAFADKGIKIKKTPTAVFLHGKLRAGEYTLRGDVSSQFVTGLLLALPLAEGESRITVLPPVESRGYINITLDVLQSFGIRVFEPEENTFIVPGGQRYSGTDCAAEGDWSNAAFFHALSAMGADLKIKGLNKNSKQSDRRCVDFFKALKCSSPEIDLSDNPDLALLLMAFAAMQHGAVFSGTKRLSLKESDRASAMAAELRKIGAEIEVNNNSVNIIKTTLHPPTEMLDSHNDHRIVMALALLCLCYGGTVIGAEAVGKSWPEFFDILRSSGADIQY